MRKPADSRAVFDKTFKASEKVQGAGLAGRSRRHICTATGVGFHFMDPGELRDSTRCRPKDGGGTRRTFCWKARFIQFAQVQTAIRLAWNCRRRWELKRDLQPSRGRGGGEQPAAGKRNESRRHWETGIEIRVPLCLFKTGAKRLKVSTENGREFAGRAVIEGAEMKTPAIHLKRLGPEFAEPEFAEPEFCRAEFVPGDNPLFYFAQA